MITLVSPLATGISLADPRNPPKSFSMARADRSPTQIGAPPVPAARNLPKRDGRSVGRPGRRTGVPKRTPQRRGVEHEAGLFSKQHQHHDTAREGGREGEGEREGGARVGSLFAFSDAGRASGKALQDAPARGR